MCRAKGTFSACLGPRCSLARRGSARFSECGAPYDHLYLSLSLLRTCDALFSSFSLAPLFLLLFPREWPASRFQEDSNRLGSTLRRGFWYDDLFVGISVWKYFFSFSLCLRFSRIVHEILCCRLFEKIWCIWVRKFISRVIYWYNIYVCFI